MLHTGDSGGRARAGHDSDFGAPLDKQLGDVLTALLLVAYNELGEAAEAADATVKDRGDHLGRWIAACTAVRRWALDHPGDYALLYGSVSDNEAYFEHTIIRLADDDLGLTSGT